jgi:hypothetical protein
MMANRAADDYAAIRARMEELRREREQAARMVEAEPVETGRGRIAGELRARLFPRRTGVV